MRTYTAVAILAAMFCLTTPLAMADEPALKIDQVWCLDNDGDKRPDHECELGDSIIVVTSNLNEWMDVSADRDPAKLLLILNGQRLEGRGGVLFGEEFEKTKVGEKTEEKKTGDMISFLLRRKADNQHNREAWKLLLARSKLFEPRSMELRVGLQDGPASYRVGRIQLQVMSAKLLWIVIVAFLLLLVFFLVLASKSDIIRIPGPDPQGQNQRKMYSLARSQMAWWFFIVLGSFLYIWVVTGDVQTLTAGVLGLIGISTATGFTATMVDISKRTNLENNKMKLATEKASLESTVRELTERIAATPQPANVDELRDKKMNNEARIKEIDVESKALPDIEQRTSKNILSDILQDDQGITFHRFQIFAWTIVLGIVFVRSVYTDLSMPEFDATLLGLMGISSATYIGFKFPPGPTQ